MDWTALSVSLWLGAGTIAILLPCGSGSDVCWPSVISAGKLFVEALVTVPLVLPPTVLGFYCSSPSVPARRSAKPSTRCWWVMRCRSPSRGCCSPSPCDIPFVVQPIQRGFEAIPIDVRDAAACCGLTPWQRFLAHRTSARVAGHSDGGHPHVRAYARRVWRGLGDDGGG